MKEQERIQYIDLLRILATFFVIILHVSANNLIKYNVNSFEWNILNIYDSMSRWTVPVFVMISGAIFLSREVDIKKIITKNIFRIVIAFFFWALIYALAFSTYSSKIEFVNMLISGKYHMWFLPMIIGLYLLTPILKKITEGEKTIKYFLVLTFVFSFLIPWSINIISELKIEKLDSIILSIKTNWINNFGIAFGYTGYFVLGHYLKKVELSKKTRRIIYVLGIIGLLMTIIFTCISSNLANRFVEKYYNNFAINTLLVVVAVFVFAKYNFKTNNVIKFISKTCFGIFLIHVLIIEKFGLLFKFNVSSFNPIFSVPIVCLIVFIASGILSMIINYIPMLKKYIV